MKRNQLLSWYLITTILESFLVASVIFVQNFQPGKYFLNAGLTLKNFLIVSGCLAISGLSLLALAYIHRKKHSLPMFYEWLKQDRNQILLLFVISVVLIECTQDVIFLHLPTVKPDPVFDEFKLLLKSIQPVLLWGLFFSIKTVIFLSIYEPTKNYLEVIKKHISRKEWIGFAALFLIWLGLGFTKFGYIPGTTNRTLRKQVGRFLPLTNPLLVRQIWLAVIGILLLLIVYRFWMRKRLPGSGLFRKQIWLLLAIWLVAFLAWSQLPIESNYLIEIQHNQPETIYPRSDAFYFDMEANRFLAGEGFSEQSTHVLYPLFLSILHLLSDSSYQEIIVLQYAVIGLVPVVLFLFVSKIHSKFTGLLTAVLFIMRERNGILMGSELAGPSVNTLLSEHLSLLFLIGAIYFYFSWIEDNSTDHLTALVVGGFMGASLLIRAEFLAIYLGLLAITLIFRFCTFKKSLMGILLMAAMISVIVFPWMVRNWHKTGSFYLDKGGFVSRRVSAYLENFASGSQHEELPLRGGDNQQDLFGGKIIGFLNHFGNSFQQSFLYLPNSTLPLFDSGDLIVQVGNQSQPSSLQELNERYLKLSVKSQPYYYFNWDGRVRLNSVIPVAVVLWMVVVGILQVWEKHWKIPLVLGTVVISQIVIWSFAGFSGNRFVRTVDWISLVFYCAGLQGVILYVLKRINLSAQLQDLEFFSLEAERFSLNVLGASRKVKLLSTAAILILVGLSPTLLEDRMPKAYPNHELQRIINTQLQGYQNTYPLDKCRNQTPIEELKISYGMALYPRFFSAGERIGDHRKGTVPDPVTNRIDFYLVGTTNTWASIPAEKAEMIFPGREDVIVVGQMVKNTYLEPESRNQSYLRVECMFIVEASDMISSDSCIGPSCLYR